MREEQRGSLPEPCPDGSRTRPPWLPPAPPGVLPHPSGTPGAPLGVSLIQAIFPLLNDAAAVHFALRNHTPASDDPLRLPTLAETRQRLVDSVEELHARLLFGDADLSDPLLRIFQNQLLDRLCRVAGSDHSADLHLALAKLSFQEYPDGKIELPLGWTTFPFPPDMTPATLLQMTPRAFTRSLVRHVEAAIQDDGSFLDASRFGERVLHPLVALLVGAFSSVEWITERERQITFQDSLNTGRRGR